MHPDTKMLDECETEFQKLEKRVDEVDVGCEGMYTFSFIRNLSTHLTLLDFAHFLGSKVS